MTLTSLGPTPSSCSCLQAISHAWQPLQLISLNINVVFVISTNPYSSSQRDMLHSRTLRLVDPITGSVDSGELSVRMLMLDISQP